MEQETINNNKRIIKNTIFLYTRMLLLMGISLYTTRVNLQALGVEDYGIYNVIGGIVALFSILSQSLSSAISRFLNFEMGKGNFDRLSIVFSSSVTIQIVMAILIALLTEIIGVWFINNKLVIPSDRLYAANWVFQFSILSFCINLISVPYNASIIAHEKMSAFAYISIYEGVAKLIICYMVMISPIDKLIYYAGLIVLLNISIRFIYSFYCKRHFSECHYQLIYDKDLIKELFSYAGWNFVGASASVLRTQGGNIIINLFEGPTINAARAVANQVNHAVSGFSNNFMTAIKPQITKSYASGNYEYMTSLVNQSARFSYYLLLFISLPILVNINFILSIWLQKVPDRSSYFVILTIIFTLLESLSMPLITAQLATGNVRNYQLIVGGINLLNLPVSYIIMKLGGVPETFLYVAIFFSIICLFARLVLLRININFSIVQFTNRVIKNCFIVTIISIMIPILLYVCLDSNTYTFILNVMLCWLFTGLSIYYVGCTKQEREKVGKIIIKKIKQF